MRCDANISLRPIDENGEVIGALLNPKTEIKNLNSFKFVERGLEHEIERQTKLWDAGNPPMESTTRGWNDVKGITEDQRSKEDAADYRFFPDPDIPPLKLAAMAEEMRHHLPELPAARRLRFANEYKLKPADARQICEDPALADFVEHTFSELGAWMNAMPEFDAMDEEALQVENKKMSKAVAGWILSKLLGLLSERGGNVRTMKITPENMAEFITLIVTRKLNNVAGLKVLNAMLDDGSDPTHIMEDKQLGQVSDEGALAEIIDRVIESNPAEVARYQAGEDQLIKFLIGMVMKASEGTADPALAKNILLVKLKAE